MSEFWKTVVAFICGAGGLAIINIVQERWKWRADRKAKKEDMAEQKEDRLERLTTLVEGMSKKMEESEQEIDALKTALRCVLLDRVVYLGQSYIRDGEIDFDDRRRLREMHAAYHMGLGGNGDADAIMHSVDGLPLKK